MANPDEILSILENLLHAFPGQKLTRATLKVYIDHLADIHPQLLQQCVNRLIEKSTWFPRVSEIRSEAARIVGHNQISLWQPPLSHLWDRYYQLQHDFYHHRILDERAWLDLAEEFSLRNCPHSAAATRQRISDYQHLMQEESLHGVGKVCFPHKNYP